MSNAVDPNKLDRRVFPWVTHEDPFKEHKSTDRPPPKTIAADEVVKRYGVPRAVLERYIQNQITQAEMFHSLPTTLLFVIAYAAMVIVHDDAVVVRAVEDSIVFDIIDNANFAFDSDFMGHKNIYDVNSIPDFWSWFSLGFLPLMFTDPSSTDSEPFFPPGGNSHEFFQKLQDVRWIQARQGVITTTVTVQTSTSTTTTSTTTTTTTSTSTTTEPNASNVSTTDRSNATDDETEEDDAVAPPAPPPPIDPKKGVLLHYNRIVGGIKVIKENSKERKKCPGHKDLVDFYNKTCYTLAYPMDPMSWTARRKTYPDNITWFYVRDTEEERNSRALEMEMSSWFNEETERIQIAIPVYTAEFGLHTLITVNFYMSHGGRIWKQILPLSSYAQWYTETYYIVYDSVWFLGLMHIFVSEMREVSQVVKFMGIKGIWKEYLSFWNAVDWLSVFTGFTIVSLAYLSFGQSGLVNAQGLALGEIINAPLGDREKREAMISEYMDLLYSLVKYVHFLKVVLSCYPLIIVLRLFKAFTAQPRLALVTETLRVSSVDLFHFLIVFTCVFFVLSIAGMMLFGRDTVEFGTIPHSINSVFRLCLGDFDWDKLKMIDDIAGPVYLIFVIVILSLLLLNITLAMVMDGYSEVKKASVSSDTVFTEIKNIISRSWNVHRGNWVPLEKILEALGQLQRQRKADPAGSSTSKRKLNPEEARKGPILLGRDSKAEVGMVVEPANPDIKKFAGWGTIYQVGHGHRKVRVKHEDGIIREYDIGQDLNYELKLAKDETPRPFEGSEKDSIGAQVISTERLIKVVLAYDKTLKMSENQAIQLMIDTVVHYYKDRRTDEKIDSVRAMVIKVAFREEKIRKGIQGMRNAGRRFLTAADEVKLLGKFLKQFYKAVSVDRKHFQAQKAELEHEVQDMRMRLLLVQPGELNSHPKRIHQPPPNVKDKDNNRNDPNNKKKQEMEPMDDDDSVRKDPLSPRPPPADRQETPRLTELQSGLAHRVTDDLDDVHDDVLLAEISDLLDLHRASEIANECPDEDGVSASPDGGSAGNDMPNLMKERSGDSIPDIDETEV